MSIQVIRTFIAIDLPPAIKHELDLIVQSFKEKISKNAVKWIKIENIHLTLKFLGDTPLEKIPKIKQELATLSNNIHPFSLTIENLGVFPGFSKPRVVWIGCMEENPQEMNLVNLHKEVEAGMSKIGFAPDNKQFNPHLTLVRLSNNASPAEVKQVSEVVKLASIKSPGRFQVDSIHLYQSDLNPQGAKYSRLFTCKLSSSLHEV